MAQVDSTKLASYCTDISNHIRNAFPQLDLHFILYHDGEKADKIARLLPHLMSHPAYEEAASLLKFKNIDKDMSGFLGVAEGTENTYLKFRKKKKKYLAFIALNISQYSTLDDMTFDANYFSAHLMDKLSNMVGDEIPKDDVASAEKKHKHKIKLLTTNLKADIYSVLQSVRERHYDAPKSLALKRAIETLTPQSDILSEAPETHAFPIAMDAVNHAIQNQIFSSIILRSKNPVVSQFQLANQIAMCFEIEDLDIWCSLSKSCQTMAWEGFSASQILGAAIHTSTDPFVKAMGLLLSDITNLSPVESEFLPTGYNPFADNEINRITHDSLVDDTFEMALIHSIEAESHLPLLRMANNQNDALLKGKISGWCANSLHAAAKAYDNAESRGIPATQAARLEFQSERIESNWNHLKDLHAHIVKILRSGRSATLNDIMNWTNNNPDLSFLQDSIATTLENKKYTSAPDKKHPTFA